jgi:hypothetical protein
MVKILRLQYVKTDSEELLKVVEKLRLYNADASHAFLALDIPKIAEDHDVSDKVAEIRRGWSHSNVKKFRNNRKYVPKKIPLILAGYLFNQLKFDVTQDKLISAFKSLDFEIQLKMDAIPMNTADGHPSKYGIENFDFEIHEAKGIADVDGKEIRVRIGFEETRISLRADELQNVGNRVVGETPIDATNTTVDEEYRFHSGNFDMRLVSRNPLSWVLDDKDEDGKPMDGRGIAKQVALITTNHGSKLVAELTAKEMSLTVRCVGHGDKQAPNSVVEANRKRMAAALIRKSFADKVDEFLLLELPLFDVPKEIRE